jgi:hypothetical protein
MDIFIVVTVMFVAVLGILIMGVLTAQQNGQLNDIRAKLSKLNEPDKITPNAETLRIERAKILDPLVLIEVSLNQAEQVTLTEEQFQEIDDARTGVKKIVDQLKHSGEWIGPPYDLEWVEYLERMPRLKSCFLKMGLKPD